MFEHENQEPTNQLPLEDTLDLLAAEADDRELAVAAGELATELRQGASLADATTTLSADLPPAVRGLLEAGVRSGNPAAVVEGYARSRQTAQAVASRDAYQAALARSGIGSITTEIAEAGPFYYAEEYHQQYLAKNPNGYCGLGGTGVTCDL